MYVYLYPNAVHTPQPGTKPHAEEHIVLSISNTFRHMPSLLVLAQSEIFHLVMASMGAKELFIQGDGLKGGYERGLSEFGEGRIFHVTYMRSEVVLSSPCHGKVAVLSRLCSRKSEDMGQHVSYIALGRRWPPQTVHRSHRFLQWTLNPKIEYYIRCTEKQC